MKIPIRIFLLVFCSLIINFVYGQNQSSKIDSISILGGTSISIDSLNNDPNKIIEDAPLDISQYRGLFIHTQDGKMQLRLLGSVRYLMVYDQLDMKTKNCYFTYELPVGEDNLGPPNYYNSLKQSRLGFEVTRQTAKGNVFVRLETDFLGGDNLRIRHAYGQYRKFLFGQTWSVFTQISTAPSTVDFCGPTGSNAVRTPQIRFTDQNILPGLHLSVALEYFKPDVANLDSVGTNIFLLIPDLTLRLEKEFKWGELQFSGILPTLTAELDDGNYASKNGYGISLSALIRLNTKNIIYFQSTGGKAITRFYGDFSGNQLDLLIDANYNTYLPLSFGGFLTYEYYWSEKIFTNVSYGLIILEQFSFYPQNAFYYGQSIHVNTFWNITDGARMGFEYIYGQRDNKDNTFGNSHRINAMIYYDF